MFLNILVNFHAQGEVNGAIYFQKFQLVFNNNNNNINNFLSVKKTVTCMQRNHTIKKNRDY